MEFYLFVDLYGCNQNKKGKIKSAEQIDQINRSTILEGYNVVSVRHIWVGKQKNKMPYSTGFPEVPMD